MLEISGAVQFCTSFFSSLQSTSSIFDLHIFFSLIINLFSHLVVYFGCTDLHLNLVLMKPRLLGQCKLEFRKNGAQFRFY